MRILKTAIKNLLRTMGFEIVNINDIYTNKALRILDEKKRICWPRLAEVSLTAFEDDEEFHLIYEKSEHATQMVDTSNPLRRQRFFETSQLLRQADLGRGDVCEVGCFRGLSAHIFSQYIKQAGQRVTFQIFDSFQGLSELEPVDVPEDWDQRYEGEINWGIDKLQEQFACPLEVVKENLSEFDFIHYYEGWIPTRFHEVEDRSFSFVHIDVDLYRPIYEAFQFFYPRLITYGIMVFDDYGATQFPGAKKAVDECLRQHDNNFFISTASGVAFLIKGL